MESLALIVTVVLAVMFGSAFLAMPFSRSTKPVVRAISVVLALIGGGLGVFLAMSVDSTGARGMAAIALGCSLFALYRAFRSPVL